MASWPMPAAPILLAILVLAAAVVVYLLNHYVIRGNQVAIAVRANTLRQLPAAISPHRLPILAGFTTEILPALALLWTGILVAYAVTESPYLWTILPWATVSTVMLWPVGRRLKRGYLSYRSVGFIIGVISMAYIPFAGFGMISDLSFKAKSAIFFGLVVDLTALGILPGLRWFIGKPIGMFFRPDLLFGDGRVLATGTLALVLGMRYIIGAPGPKELAWPLPAWNWYAIFYAMVAGLIPLIALRGMTKLVMRLRRMRDAKWNGWVAVFIREGLLVVTVLSIGYGFHNAFMGLQPFNDQLQTSDPDFWPAVGITVAGAAFLIFVRGGHKMLVGDPFIRETWKATLVKQVLLVVGLVVLFYGFMSLLHTGPMAIKMGVNGLRTWDNMAKEWTVGLPIFFWGVALLIPVRVLIQHYQRHAIVGQMAAVIIPNQMAEHRARLLRRMLIDGLLTMPLSQRKSYMVTMNQALAGAAPEARAATTGAMVGVLADLPTPQRDTIMETQAAALGSLRSEERVTRMADMMSAVSQLPDEKRRAMMDKMASMLA